MIIKPIETEYHGYKFRSRLEARWAVFFDEIKVTWEYEKEGYDLGGIWYLPDFWIYEWKSFVEIKGDPSELDDGLNKLSILSNGVTEKCFLLYGSPDYKLYQMLFPPVLNVSDENNKSYLGTDNPCKILQCRRCDGHWYAHIESLHWGPLGNCKNNCNSEKYPYLSNMLLNAHNKAKSYRF